MSEQEQWNDFFDTCQTSCPECNSKSFNVLYLPTPCTPPEIGAIALRCIVCQDVTYLKAEHYHLEMPK